MQKADTSFIIKVAVTALIIFGSQFLPGVDCITPYGMNVVGIFAGLIFGYCFVDIVIPSMMALVALGLSGYATVPEVLMMSLGSDTVLYLTAILILSAMLVSCGLSDKLVNIIVTSKMVQGRPWALSIMFMLAAYVVSLFVNAAPTVIILWGLLIELFKKAGFKGGEKWPLMMMFGTMYVASVSAGVPSFQIAVVSNYGLLGIVSQGALKLDPTMYMVWSFICSVVLVAAYLLFARFVINPDMERVRNIKIEADENGKKFNTAQKATAILFGVFVLGLLLPSFLPVDNPLAVLLATLGSSGWGMLVVLVGLLLRDGGQPLYRFADIFAKGVIWEIVFMVATVFTLVAAVTDDKTGVSQLLTNVVSPMSEALGPLMFFLVISLIFVVVANFTNTVAIACIFIPVLYIVAQDMEFNMLLFVAITVFAGNISFLVPSASVNAVMIYEQEQWIPVKERIVLGVFAMIVTYIVMVAVGGPLANVFLPV